MGKKEKKSEYKLEPIQWIGIWITIGIIMMVLFAK